MSKQPAALHYAEVLENFYLGIGRMDATGAAAELRRLHALCAEWESKAATWMASPEAAKRLQGYRELAQQAAEALIQRDVLLVALTIARDRIADMLKNDDGQAFKEARKWLPRIEAAITQATNQESTTHVLS